MSRQLKKLCPVVHRARVAAKCLAALAVACVSQACERQDISFESVWDPWPKFLPLRALQLDGDYLFFTDGTDQLHSCAKHDCEATRRPHVVVYRAGSRTDTFPTQEGCLAVHRDALFHKDTSRLAFWPVTANGPSSDSVQLHEFVQPIRCIGMVVDDENVYLGDEHSTIVAFSRSGDDAGRIVAYASVESSSRFLAQQAYLYWGNLDVNPGLHRVLKDGSSKPELLVSGPIAGLAADESHLYWIDANTATLASCEPANCPSTTQVLAVGLSMPHDLKVRNGTAFWLEELPDFESENVLRSCSIAGCPEGANLAVPQGLGAYVVDDTSIYGSIKVSESPNGSLWRFREFPRDE